MNAAQDTRPLTETQDEEMRAFITEHEKQYYGMMSYYACALMQLETRIRDLDISLAERLDRRPVESIRSRLKTADSIMAKLRRKGMPLSLENIWEHIRDAAGIRVVCSYAGDIRALEEGLLAGEDMKLLERKDYIREPKENGYRSLHLIVETPVALSDTVKNVKAEIQLRTISMDWWASLEHKIRYKKDIADPEAIERELLLCAEIGAELDSRMEALQEIALVNSQIKE